MDTPHRSPLSLAALAAAAVPGLKVVSTARPPWTSLDFDAAQIGDSLGRTWIVQTPRHSVAGAGQEAQITLLKELAKAHDSGLLPFDVMRPVAFTPLPEGGRAMVCRELVGQPLQVASLHGGPGLAANLGRAIAALHEMPVDVIEAAGLPVYDADSYRRRHLAELDEAAKSGWVPAYLLQRWERRLEDVSLWRFRPVVTHGDLAAEHLLTDNVTITGLVNFADAKVADPADDLAWLLPVAAPEAIEAIVESYSLRRTSGADDKLLERAQLLSELALSKWLLFGVSQSDSAIIEDAKAMLRELEQSLRASVD